MKINEIINPQMTTDQAIGLIKNFVGGDYGNTEALTIAINTIIGSDSKAKYTGVMYRVIFVQERTLLSTPDLRMILANIHRYDLSQTGGQHRFWYSWSHDLDTSETFAKQNIEDDELALILEQTGSGLNVPYALNQNFNNENEIIAPYDTVNIAKIGYVDQYETIRIMPARLFNNVVKAVKQKYKD